MNINFSGFNENVLTFECADDVKVGDSVDMLSSGKVYVAPAGKNFVGIAVAVRDGYAAVQVQGYCERNNVANIHVGLRYLVADSNNGVREATYGQGRWVIYSDDETVGFLL